MMREETDRLLGDPDTSPRPAAGSVQEPRGVSGTPSYASLGPDRGPRRSVVDHVDENGIDDTEDVIMDHGLTASMSVQDHATSDTQSLMHLLKGNIGTGILAMPSAINYAGLWVGTAGLVVLGTIALHCMHLLVQCSHHMCHKTGRPHLDYGGVAKKAVENSLQHLPVEKRVRIGKASKILVNTFLCITQIGFCTVYILFIAENITQVVSSASHGYQLNIRLCAFIVFVMLIPLVFVRNLKHLAPLSMLANILTVIGLIITIQYCFRDLPPASKYPAFNSWSQLPFYFGIAIYAFEGIGVVLPIENKMRYRENFLRWNGVLNTGMILVICMYIAVGFYGYMKFGSDVKGSITLNLPEDDWLYSAVKVMFAIGIYITYGLQFYVPILVMWTGIRRKLTNVWLLDHGEKLLRIFFLILTFLLAISIPRLDLMISLVGALASSTLALVFPPALEILAFWPDGELRWWHVLKDVLIMLLGVVGFVAGTVCTIIKLTEPE